MSRFVIISGCSGGGKSTLLGALARRGYARVEEPGRRIVREELRGAGAALPWTDEAAFLRRAVAMATRDLRAAARLDGQWVFFDRGLIDALVAIRHLTGEPIRNPLTARYHRSVFLAPPWPEIYVEDRERRHGLAAATAEYERLAAAYPQLGFEITVLPKVDVAARADFVLETLALSDR